MGIGAFGIDLASKFATEKCKTLAGPLWLRIRYREWAAIRSGSAGLDFHKGRLRFRFWLFFHTVQGCRPAHLLLARRHYKPVPSDNPQRP